MCGRTEVTKKVCGQLSAIVHDAATLRFSGIICGRVSLRSRENYPRMKRLTSLCAAAAVAILGYGGTVDAAEGDAAAGKANTRMCAGCHGISGYKTAFPVVYSVPKLGGQHAAYIVKSLQAYKSGERSHPTMKAIAAGLSDKDMADLAAYYATASTQAASR